LKALKTRGGIRQDFEIHNGSPHDVEIWAVVTSDFLLSYSGGLRPPDSWRDGSAPTERRYKD